MTLWTMYNMITLSLALSRKRERGLTLSPRGDNQRLGGFAA
jgi:hypothetical protein